MSTSDVLKAMDILNERKIKKMKRFSRKTKIPLHPHVKKIQEGMADIKDKYDGIIYYEEWYDKYEEINEQQFHNSETFDNFNEYCYFIWSTIPRVKDKKYFLLEENIYWKPL